MSRENIERFRRELDAFNQGGDAGADVTPDFELHQASSIIDSAGVFRGRDAMRDSLAELRGSFEDLKFEAEEFIEAPGGEVVVFVLVKGRGRGSLVQIDNPIAWVLTFREDKLARLVAYEERSEALEAVGLGE